MPICIPENLAGVKSAILKRDAMNTTLAILGICVLVSLLGLIGGLLLLWKVALTKRWSGGFISFAAGTILAAAFLDLLPEAAQEIGKPERVFSWMLVGILTFFLLEKFLLLHHHSHGHETDTHEERLLKSARPLILFGDTLHNFLDGAIIAIAFLTYPALGIITAIAVAAHEIPQEIGDFSILLASGMKRGKVLLWNVVVAMSNPLGALAAIALRNEITQLSPTLLAFIAGTFLYLALADLIPTIKHEHRLSRSFAHIVLLLAGVLLIWQIGVLLPE